MTYEESLKRFEKRVGYRSGFHPKYASTEELEKLLNDLEGKSKELGKECALAVWTGSSGGPFDGGSSPIDTEIMPRSELEDYRRRMGPESRSWEQRIGVWYSQDAVRGLVGFIKTDSTESRDDT